MTLLSLFLRGGILMYVLVLISIAVVAIIIEKYLQLAKTRKTNLSLCQSIAGLTEKNEIRARLAEKAHTGPLAAMLERLYNSETEDGDLLHQNMESTANLELHKMEKGMGWLSTFAAIAPLIGFLGTVTGMVRVFMNIQGQSQSSVDINSLAGGIWEALLTTIGGLIVGIVAIVFYNDLVQHMENIAREMQNTAVESLINYHKLND